MSAIHAGRTNRVPAQTEASRAVDQRGEIHVGLSDEALTTLAVRAVYPRPSLWRRIIARIGCAR